MTKQRKDRSLQRTAQFKSDLKRALKHKKCDVDALNQTMKDIVARKPLAAELRDHKLTGKYPNRRDGNSDCRECHTSNDWLLVYRFPDDDTVIFIRTGTHSDLF